MGQIHVLDEITSNQIAAGEVIERPESVVKELVENALDAGASQIDVHIEDGGSRRIVITDNGSGMEPDDAVLCFSRYATSKLSNVSDLSSLHSFGFRGEALASIASVAKVRLLTRTQNKNTATEVLVHGGKIVSVQESGAPVGTRIEVEDLFFNVPARLKFLKTPRSESGAIEQVIRRSTLSKPDVGFSLRIDGDVKLDARQAQSDADLSQPRRIERALACLGEDCRHSLYPFEAQSDWIKISGYVVSPLVSRKDSKGMYLYINGRSVEDKTLVQAVRVAYRSLLEIGRHPICALHVEISPHEVDVNVHPQKREVRFSNPSRVQSHIIALLSDFLATTPWLRSLPQSAIENLPHVPYSFATPEPLSRRSEMRWEPRESNPESIQLKLPAKLSLQGSQTYAELRAIGQIDGTFLILEGPSSMLVVDQHAAHERVLFEKLKKQVALSPLPSQPLLFPIQVRLPPREMSALFEHASLFERYGFVVEPFGESSAVVKAHPTGMRSDDMETILKDSLSDLDSHGHADSLDQFTHHMCAQIACHSSVRAGQVMQLPEINALLKQLDEIDYAAHCPHGRPVVKSLTFSEIGQWFHR